MTTRALVAAARRRLRRRGSPRMLVAGPVLALVVAACSTAAGAGTTTDSAGYTYAPAYAGGSGSAPSAMPAMGGDPSASAMAMPPASAEPAPASAPAPVGPSPTGGTAPAGATVHISAKNIEFDTDQLAAPAGQAWVLEFDNNDAGIPHNVEIRDATGASVFKGQIVTGPMKVSYQVPALTAGSYTFLCDVHPTMTGALAVG